MVAATKRQLIAVCMDNDSPLHFRWDAFYEIRRRKEKPKKKLQIVDTTERFDNAGRLLYNPLYHPNHGKPFTTEELEYMCKFYDMDGKKSMAMALGKTEYVVSGKVYSLKKCGLFDHYKNLNRYW